MLRLLPDAVLSLTYPQECCICDREVTSISDGVACSDCWNRTRIFDGTEALCSKCGAFLFGTRTSAKNVRCQRCKDQHFDHAFAVGIYEEALKASVLSLKKIPRIPLRLRRQITEALARMVVDELVVIPVPLSARRFRERGFNQAEIIASVIARALDRTFDRGTLVRDVETPMHRAGMDRKARAATVKNAFRVTRPRLIDGRNVLLVDDVLTSGSTASVCSGVLKKSGAATVTVMTIARTA